MALDFLKLHDPEIEKARKAKPEKDPMPAMRKRLSDGIDKALAALERGEKKLIGWFNSDEHGHKLTIRYKNKPLKLEGQSQWDVRTAKDAKEFYEKAKAAAGKNELDGPLRLHGLSLTTTGRKGGISPEAAKERGIRAAATRAANKAAREAGKK